MTIGMPPMTQATPKTACGHAQHDENTYKKPIYKSNITKTNIINIFNLKFNLKKSKKHD